MKEIYTGKVKYFYIYKLHKSMLKNQLYILKMACKIFVRHKPISIKKT